MLLTNIYNSVLFSITEKYLPAYYDLIKMKYMKKNIKMCSQINNKEYKLEDSLKGFDIPIYLIDELKKFSLLNLKVSIKVSKKITVEKV